MEPFSETFLCFQCKHREPGDMGCKAFPEGIPGEICSGEWLHTKPYPGQTNTLVFQPKEQEYED